MVCTCVYRLASDGGTTIPKELQGEPVRGTHEVEIRDDRGHVSTVAVDLRPCRRTACPPTGKNRRCPASSPTALHADERGTPAGREPIRWRLLANRPVDDLAGAIAELDWYARGRRNEAS